MSFQSFTFSGNLTRDPELRTAASGNYFCNFTVAVNGLGKDDKALFVDCVCWNKQAENLAKYKHKGECVICQGQIALREYKKRDGSTGTSLDCVCDRVAFVGNKNTSADNGAPVTDGSYIPPPASNPQQNSQTPQRVSVRANMPDANVSTDVADLW